MATIIQKKICMIGDFAVGKTSLVARFVRQTFSDKYLTTVGVKIDTKAITLSPQTQMKLVVWDIAGTDAISTTTASYLRGAAGYFLIVDGTRLSTWQNALKLQEMVRQQIGEKPFIVLLNKADLQNQWELSAEVLQPQRRAGWILFETSAKTGEHVEESFIHLANLMLAS